MAGKLSLIRQGSLLEKKSTKAKRKRPGCPCQSLWILGVLGLYLWVEAAYFSESKDELGLASLLFEQQSAAVEEKPQMNEVVLEKRTARALIAYAISITHCKHEFETNMIKVLDGPAVLAHSIHLSSIQHPESGSHYDYRLYAFVHPQARNCTGHLPGLNYTVKFLDTPINVTMIKNEGYQKRVQMVNAGCCGEKEFLKLYSFTLEEHPIVVHMDADAMVLKPMDHLFDKMLQPDQDDKDLTDVAMWPKDQTVSRRIHSFFTRDYPMGTKTMSVHHVGMQGGFWILRPNLTAFEEFRHLIIEGNFSGGWYDSDVKYKGFYGAAMIQGLVGFFYGHIHPDQAIELDPCVYNNMAANPWDVKNARCYVPETPTCTDCRHVNHSSVYSHHFTLCGKPWWCKKHDATAKNSSLCYEMTESWFQIRYHLETSGWGMPGPALDNLSPTDRHFYGYCPPQKKNGNHAYAPMHSENNLTRH